MEPGARAGAEVGGDEALARVEANHLAAEPGVAMREQPAHQRRGPGHGQEVVQARALELRALPIDQLLEGGGITVVWHEPQAAGLALERARVSAVVLLPVDALRPESLEVGPGTVALDHDPMRPDLGLNSAAEGVERIDQARKPKGAEPGGGQRLRGREDRIGPRDQRMVVAERRADRASEAAGPSMMRQEADGLVAPTENGHSCIVAPAAACMARQAATSAALSASAATISASTRATSCILAL